MPGAILTIIMKKLCDEPRPCIPRNSVCGSLLVEHDGSQKSMHRRLCVPLKNSCTVASASVNDTLRNPSLAAHTCPG
jgi:hypothetical protein